MINKIISRMRHISLTRQLFIILALITAMIFLVVSPLIESNTHSIIDHEMFDSILTQQTMFVSFLEGKGESSENGFGFRNDNNELLKELKVGHIFYDAKNNIFEKTNNYSNDVVLELQASIFMPALYDMIDNGKDTTSLSAELTGRFKGYQVYYIITQSATYADCYWISFAFNDITSDLLSNIRHELINVLYVVMMIIALVLTIWIYSMIKPLRQIQNYIRAIKQGNKFDLNLTRMDEIGEVGEALKEMEAELLRQNQLQSDLIHNISHDLKTPIAIIRSYSECMKDDIYPYGDKNSSLDVIIENADRLEKKVKDFLYLNRLDYLDENEMTKEEIDVTEIARHLITELAPLNENIHFITDLESTMFIGQNEHWYSALMNILDNAMRYAATTIRVTIRDNKIAIFNDGSHIDEQLKNEIFKPYTKGPKGNFGLGMSIVYKIVTMYHCEINVDNLDDGVVFTITKKSNI